MRNITRDKYNAMLLAMATAYGVKNPKEQFEATEPMTQKLNQVIQKSSDFLSHITIAGRVDLVGEVLQMQIHNTIAGRTDTSDGTKERQAQFAKKPDGLKYEMKKTNFDVGIKYELLDTWARYGNFRSMYMQAVYKRIALDRILIGFFGESAADDTDRETYPKLQDVNIGWFKKLQTHMPSHFISDGATAGSIKIGATGDYKTLDHLVYDISSVIEDHHKTGGEIAIIGKELLTNDTGKILAELGQTPSERRFFNQLEKNYGGYKCYTCPLFPEKGLMIIDPKLLHIYYQLSSLRRKTEDQPAKDRIVDFISMNEAYCIEDYEAVAAINHDNVSFV